ncbi:hypothetical protein M5G07_11215 [Serratia symbiotica]|nr:hypothetical protein [Serratia symbiotica]
MHGIQPMENGGQINFNFILGVGEYTILSHLPTFPPSHLPTFPPSHLPTFPPSHFPTFPPFTLSGPCNIMGFEGLPGGEMDCWQEIYSAGQHLQQSLSILRRWLPWEADRCVGVELTDAMGIMAAGCPYHLCTSAGADAALGAAGVGYGRCSRVKRFNHQPGQKQRRQMRLNLSTAYSDRWRWCFC